MGDNGQVPRSTVRQAQGHRQADFKQHLVRLGSCQDVRLRGVMRNCHHLKNEPEDKMI